MRFLNKIISCILWFIILTNSSLDAFGAELIDASSNIRLYAVPVDSMEYTKDNVTFYEVDGDYYLSLEDISDFTRCTLVEKDETISLQQGVREVVIDKATGHMIDSDLVDQGNINIYEYEGKVLCEGIPMLMYLGATCTINDNNKLEVLMPAFTLWESLMPDYLDYYFDLAELYGGEDGVKISLAGDILMDMLDGVSGHGIYADADTHLEDALYEILNVDMMKYSSVQDSAAAQNQKINDFLSSAVFGATLSAGVDTYDTVAKALEYYARIYVSAQNDILLDKMIQTDDMDYASELVEQIKERIFEQSAIKANLKKAKPKTAKAFMDIGLLAFDTAVTSYSLMQYDDDTKNLFSRTINQEMFQYANYYDIDWYPITDKISDTLKSHESIVANTAIDKVVEFVLDKANEKGVETALSAFSSKASIYANVAKIGLFVASLINYNSNQGYSADMNAIWLNAVQYDIAKLTASLTLKERDEFHLSNAESLDKLKDMYTLYYRTVIAFAENFAKSIKELSPRSQQKWVSWFSSTSEASVANYAAIYLYRITNCTVNPIVKYSELSDEILTDEWVGQISMNNDSLISETLKSFAEEKTYVYGKSFDAFNPLTPGFTSRFDDIDFDYIDSDYSLGYEICDFDNDGQDELLVLGLTESSGLVFEMYEYENGNVVKAASENSLDTSLPVYLNDNPNGSGYYNCFLSGDDHTICYSSYSSFYLLTYGMANPLETLRYSEGSFVDHKLNDDIGGSSPTPEQYESRKSFLEAMGVKDTTHAMYGSGYHYIYELIESPLVFAQGDISFIGITDNNGKSWFKCRMECPIKEALPGQQKNCTAEERDNSPYSGGKVWTASEGKPLVIKNDSGEIVDTLRFYAVRDRYNYITETRLTFNNMSLTHGNSFFAHSIDVSVLDFNEKDQTINILVIYTGESNIKYSEIYAIGRDSINYIEMMTEDTFEWGHISPGEVDGSGTFYKYIRINELIEGENEEQIRWVFEKQEYDITDSSITEGNRILGTVKSWNEESPEDFQEGVTVRLNKDIPFYTDAACTTVQGSVKKGTSITANAYNDSEYSFYVKEINGWLKAFELDEYVDDDNCASNMRGFG